MIPAPPPATDLGIERLIRSRCSQLGLSLWCLRGDGSVRAAPAPERSALSPESLRAIAADWHDDPSPAPIAIEPGCWALPIPIVERRARVGYYVAVLNSNPGARSSVDESAPALHRMLTWMVDDLRAGVTAQADLDGMSEQLMNAYETFHTVYGVGRAMGRVESPEGFVQGLVDELGATLPFAWLLCVTADDATGNRAVDGQRFAFGSFPGSEQDLEWILNSAVEHRPDAPSDAAVIVDVPRDRIASVGPQIVGQLVRSGGQSFATLIAGGRIGPEPEATSHETMLIEASGGFLGAFLENTSLYVEQEQAFIGTIKAMTSAIDAKDRYTRGHSVRVAKLSRQIARAAGLDETTAEQIYVSGLVHDVGKIGVPEAVLTKAGRLTDEEFELIRRHPDIGHDILSGIPSLKGILPGVLHHHEKWDGTGYPHGLAGERIPLMARVIGLADTFDAMSSTRSYRAAMPREKVLAEIERCAGTQFDPQLAALMPTIDLSEYDALVVEHRAVDPGPSLRAA